jgi:homoserine O-acetyltransferase
MDYFDVERDYGTLKNALSKINCRYLVISFDSDWLFTPAQSKVMVNALFSEDKDVSYCNIKSPYGHDAFLLEVEEETHLVKHFLQRVMLENGVTSETGITEYAI